MCTYRPLGNTFIQQRDFTVRPTISLSHLLGPGHISPPVHSLDVQHSATLGEASLGIMYCPLSLTGIFWSGVSKLTLLKGSDSAASSLSLSALMPPTHSAHCNHRTVTHDNIVIYSLIQSYSFSQWLFCYHLLVQMGIFACTVSSIENKQTFL